MVSFVAAAIVSIMLMPDSDQCVKWEPVPDSRPGEIVRGYAIYKRPFNSTDADFTFHDWVGSDEELKFCMETFYEVYAVKTYAAELKPRGVFWSKYSANFGMVIHLFTLDGVIPALPVEALEP